MWRVSTARAAHAPRSQAGYSHSIVNSPQKSSIGAGFPKVMNVGTMKNTMFNNLMKKSLYFTKWPNKSDQYIDASCPGRVQNQPVHFSG
jgi:hypothetical protein